MDILKRPLLRSLMVVVAVGGMATAAASAGSVHRSLVSVNNGGGSLGSEEFLNTNAGGGAVQGQVGSAALTSLSYPFGIFGLYNSSQVGFGVVGLSTTSYGVAGQSTSDYASIFGLTGGTGSALEGLTPSSPSNESSTIYATNQSYGYAGYLESSNSDGIDAIADTNGWGGYFVSTSYYGAEGISDGSYAGVLGDSATGYGVQGTSSTGDGVHGNVSNTQSAVAGIQTGTGFGMYGANNYTTATPGPTAGPFVDAGVYGQSTGGPGLYGVSFSTASPGYISQKDAGVFGFGNGGPGVEGHSNTGIGVYGQTASAGLPAIFGETQNQTGSAISFYIFNDQTDDVTYSRANGDFYTSGSITSGSDTYQARTRNPVTDMTTYSAQHTEATVEDFGSAQLVNGIATIPLASDFRQTMNSSLPYMVFLTPYGDTKGLYVASRTAAGFVVRETQSGRSSLNFDYRIVARPYGALHARLPHLRDIAPIPDRSRMLVTRNQAQTNGAALAERTMPVDTNKARMQKAHGTFVRLKAPPAPANMFRLH